MIFSTVSKGNGPIRHNPAAGLCHFSACCPGHGSHKCAVRQVAMARKGAVQAETPGPPCWWEDAGHL